MEKFILFVVFMLHRVEALPIKKCACASVDTGIQNAIGDENNAFGYLKAPNCLPYEGDQRSLNDGRIYAHVTINRHSGWVLTPDIYIQDCHEIFDCICATKGDVNLKSTWSSNSPTVATLASKQCISSEGNVNNADVWIQVSVAGISGWIKKTEISFNKHCNRATSHNSNLQLPGCPDIIPRAEWGARAPSEPHVPLKITPYYGFVHHGATRSCHTRQQCIKIVQSYQNYHMDGHGWSDIAYSFLIGEDGNIYEGRGWDSVGAHTYGHNTNGLGFCMIGNYMIRAPVQAAQDLLQKLIACALNNRKLTPTYTLLGHRDVGAKSGPTSCPGDVFYPIVQTWPHYNSTVIPSHSIL